MSTYNNSILIKNIIRSEIMVTGNKNLYNFLVEKYIDLKSVFCLSMIPEQGEDIYTLMINKNKVIMVDVSRLDSSIIETEGLSATDYLHQLKNKQEKDFLLAILKQQE
ncbi:hypothetical protein [Neisseria zoodegmatis]|uniref:Uncharacterized protein n=2 Tax=Neisseria zoodegmatis TaxID=326523 RepID=A0AB38DR28_9NEIS|nr:hypothetical protein [Neisseria zoodegmatis]SNU79724.1 Uncharacterised protein [Neisseria zoodegmatis]